MIKNIQHWWSTWFLVVGLTWLIGLTAFNIYYTYYGWFHISYIEEKEEMEWNREKVNELCVTVGERTSGYVAQQIIPLVIIVIGASGLITQNRKLNRVEPDATGQPM